VQKFHSLTWRFSVVVIILCNSLTTQTQPPRILLLVQHLKVVDPVRRHRFHDSHIIHDGLTPEGETYFSSTDLKTPPPPLRNVPRLSFRFLIVLNDLVLAKGQRRVLLKNGRGQHGALLHQVSRARRIHKVSVGSLGQKLNNTLKLDIRVVCWTTKVYLQRQRGQLKDNVRVHLERPLKDETPRLLVKQLHRPILRQLGHRLDKKLDKKVDRQRGGLAGKVVVEDLAVELQPVKKGRVKEGAFPRPPRVKFTKYIVRFRRPRPVRNTPFL
jgi:hypothetical protein